MFPLLLLETMRDMDRPPEVLEDEDLAVSLPRRFGLSDVVGRQIHRFREEVRGRRPQSVAEMEDLIRLVIRRPDAEAIFREAGRRVARHSWQERAAALRRTMRFVPRPIGLFAATRAASRLFRQLAGESQIHIHRRPVEMRITDSLTARADPSSAACSFYSGALEELLNRYTGRTYQVLHSRCQGRGAELCEWTVRVS